MNLYDIYGFVIAVEEPADKIFSSEYKYFKLSTIPKKVDLYVKVCKDQRDLPTKPTGSLKGMYIPFKEIENGEAILWYEKGTPLNVLLSFCEALMWWPNKTIMHAGGVVKNRKAFIFTGGGGVGKTSIVLNLLNQGYEYLSDDWLIVGEGRAWPLPKLIHVFDYNLKYKEIARRILCWKRFFYKPLFKLFDLGRKFSPHRFLRFGFEFLKPMFAVELQKLYPEAKVASPSPISKVFYLERQKSIDSVIVRDDISAEKLARKMAFVNLFEWNFFFREYYKYAYLYEVSSRRVESKFSHDFKIIYETLKAAKLHRVVIPQQFDLTKIKLDSILGLD